MEVIIVDTPDEVARVAANAITDLYSATPGAVLGVATGSSPVGVYDELGRRVATGELSLAAARAFMLDEYVGLPADHPEAYRNVIQRDFADKVDISPDAVTGPDGRADDLRVACATYENEIEGAGGIDLQILGIGTDGHVAFNEPGSSLASRTRIKTLTHQTRADNARFFDGVLDDVPQHCLTQGIGTILRARHLLLVATGLVTVVPLLFFASAATRLPLSTLGLLQYLAPTLQFLLGITYFGESMSTGRWVGFARVWLALVILTGFGLRQAARKRRAAQMLVAAPTGRIAG